MEGVAIESSDLNYNSPVGPPSAEDEAAHTDSNDSADDEDVESDQSRFHNIKI